MTTLYQHYLPGFNPPSMIACRFDLSIRAATLLWIYFTDPSILSEKGLHDAEVALYSFPTSERHAIRRAVYSYAKPD